MNVSTESLSEWLNLASFAPSGDNMQPWLVSKPDAQTIILKLNYKKNHILDLNHNASLIALGCFYECLFQSSPHFGIKILSTEFKDKIITLKIESSQRVDCSDAVLKIKSRVTDRGRCRALVDSNDFDLMSKVISKEEDVVFLHGAPKTLIDYWSDLEFIFWKKTRLLSDILKWLRLTPNRKTFLGMSIHSLGLDKAEVFGILVLKYLSLLGFPIEKLISKPQFTERNRKLVSSDFIIFWGDKFNDEASFDLGRKIQRVWMELNFIQISVQPMSLQSMVISEISSNQSFFEKHLPKECINLAIETLKKMQNFFSKSDKKLPLFMFRIGTTLNKVEPHGRALIF